MLHGLLYWVYSRLTLSVSSQPGDLIFVLAGKMERKAFGLALYRLGLADRLLLSVGRFEVSKMAAVSFPLSAELKAIRDRTPLGQRHFFCHMDASGIRILIPTLPRWNTYGEALGLQEYLAKNPAKRVMVVSTDIHLRRVALAFEKVFRGAGVEFQYCPVPESQSSVSKDAWWTRREDRQYVISETLKLIGYRAIFLLPDTLVRRCMSLGG